MWHIWNEIQPEEFHVYREPHRGWWAVLVIHTTRPGPALGGTRMQDYPDIPTAAEEALRLAKVMTLKAAVAEVPCGGGKLVVPRVEASERRALFHWLGELVERLGGRFFTGRDAGVTVEDIAWLRERTRHAVDERPEVVGDLDWYTALGVVEGMRACAQRLYGTQSLAELRIAVQGLGAVGRALTEMLLKEGARLYVTDLVPEKVEWAVRQGAQAVPPEEILFLEVDILAPAAVGRVFTTETVERVQAAIVCGPANDQLESLEAGDRLFERGILFAPDFVVNAGALIQAGFYYLRGRKDNSDRVRNIYYTVGEILDEAQGRGVGPHRVALDLAMSRVPV